MYLGACGNQLVLVVGVKKWDGGIYSTPRWELTTERHGYIISDKQ